MNRRYFSSLFAGAAGGAIASCQSVNVSDQRPITLKVSAAASLKRAMEAVRSAYRLVSSEVAIDYNFGGSGSLAQQIVQGAPVDIFISAAPDWMNLLSRDERLLENSRRDVLKNSLVLVVSNLDDTATIKSWTLNDLKRSRIKKIAIGEPNSVPVGRYAREALQSAGLFDALQSKLVLGKDASQVLAYVLARNVAAGIVYATDAKKINGVQVGVAIAQQTHSPIRYPAAVIKNSRHQAAAQRFLDFLSDKVAADIFRENGFELVE